MFRDPMMRQLRWGLKAEFPYTKVFILGILLTVLGSACVVASLIGIVQLAWGYYVSTGMWGGVTVTVSGLAAMYAARAQSSFSARLYFFVSVVTCLVSFAMVVLSAGGLTYRSNFYQPVRFDRSKHLVTIFLHGSVLGVGVLSLACNLLSVIVCCKFFTREKSRVEETIKLRRYRHRLSDVRAVDRNSSLRGSQGTTRTSTNSRTPLFGSDRSRKHSHRASETDSTNLKIPGERSSNRRDSDRSKGSSRSRHSHHRQPSSPSRHSPMDAEVTTVLLRDTDHNHREITSSYSTIDNARDSQAETLADSMSIQLVFDPDEEPPPPYEEARPLTFLSSDGNESETEAVDGSSNVVIPNCLPLNIPVTRISGCQMQSLQRQPPPLEPTPSQICEHPQQSNELCISEAGAPIMQTSSETISTDANATDRYDRFDMMSMTMADQQPNAAASASHPSALQERDSSENIRSEDGSASPEICALTGERMTPVAAVQPDSVSARNSATLTSRTPKHNPTPDASDSGVHIEVVKTGQNPAPSHTPSGTAHALSSESSSALPAGIHSPSSAFRPVGKRGVPLTHASPSSSVPLHNVFSPISSPATAHHTIYSPVASPSSATRFASPTSPRRTVNNMASSSSESLSRSGGAQSLSWKKIPLPSSHNHSNRTSSVPFKEVTSKTIPGPSQPPPRDKDILPHSLPKRGSKDKERVAIKSSGFKAIRSEAVGNELEADVAPKHTSKFSSPVRRHPQKAQPTTTDPNAEAKLVENNHSSEHNSRSAFVSKQPGGASRRPSNSDNFPPAAVGKQVPVSVLCSQPAVGKQVPVSLVDSCASGRTNHSDVNNSHHPNHARGHASKGGNKPVIGAGNSSFAAITNVPPDSSQIVPVTNKQSATLPSPNKAAFSHMNALDSTCRSTGCQATDDGGIASSMDRTHRWVLGTLPSGTRFQGTTKNTALTDIYGTSRNTTLSHQTRNNPLIHAASRNPAIAQCGNRNIGFPQGSTRNNAVNVTQSPTRNPPVDVKSSSERAALLAPVTKPSNNAVSVHQSPTKKPLVDVKSPPERAASLAPVAKPSNHTASVHQSPIRNPFVDINPPPERAALLAPVAKPSNNTANVHQSPNRNPFVDIKPPPERAALLAPVAKPSNNAASVHQSPTRNPFVDVKPPPERAALLAPVAKPSNGRSHGVWSRPSKAAPTAAAAAGQGATAPSSESSSSLSSPTVTSHCSPSVTTSLSSPVVNTSSSSPSVSASLSASSVSTSEPAPMQPLVPVDARPQPGPQQRGSSSSSRLPRYYAGDPLEVQARVPPLRPAPVPQVHRQRQRPQPQQPPADHQHHQLMQQLRDGEDLEQQQGKPLFSVLL